MPALSLSPCSAPGDAVFPPPNAQALLNFVAAYLDVSGLEDITGVLISETEPTAADRDKAWLKRDAGSQRVIGLYVWSSEWVPVPFIIPSGSQEPAAPKRGEIFLNTETNALRFYDGVKWTTNLWPSGATADRPENPAVGDLYFDESIGRLLRRVAAGWTTVDGALGEVRMFDGSEEEATTRNPGWTVFAELAGRFPLGASEDYAAQTNGGVLLDEMELEWAAKRRSASGGSREATATFLAELTLNGIAKTADGTKSDDITAIGSAATINLKPPYRALIFIRKER